MSSYEYDEYRYTISIHNFKYDFISKIDTRVEGIIKYINDVFSLRKTIKPVPGHPASGASDDDVNFEWLVETTEQFCKDFTGQVRKIGLGYDSWIRFYDYYSEQGIVSDRE